LSGAGKGGSAPLTGTPDGSQRLLGSRRAGCRILFLQSDRLHLTPLAWPVAATRSREIRRTAFVSDQMTHGGQKGFGMTKQGRSGHATRSPRFRFLDKLEAQKNDRNDRSGIKDPKQSVEELFHPRKPTRI
jgi:hypothetical protein